MTEDKKITQEELNEDPFKDVSDDPFKDVVKEEQTIDTAVEVTEENNVTGEEKEVEPVEEPYYGPTVKTLTKYDYRTMKYFNMYSMIYKRHFNIVYIIFGLASFGLAVYNAITNVKTVQATEGATIGINTFVFPALFVIFGFYFLYQAFFFEKSIDKNIQTHFYRNPKVVHIETTVTEKYIELKVDGQEQPFKYDWAYVQEIAEIPQYYFLFLKGQPIIIEKNPARVMEGTYEDLVKMIMDKTAAKPYKKIDKELVKKPITYVHQEDLEQAHEVEATEVKEENVEETTEEENK